MYLIAVSIFAATTTLNAQENQFDSIVDFGLPKEVKYMDSLGRELFIKENPEHFTKELPTFTMPSSKSNANTYRVGDILIKAIARPNKQDADSKSADGCSIERWIRFHRSLDHRGHQEIKPISTGRLLVEHGRHVRETMRYSIAGDNLTCDKMFSITIYYKIKDADKAKQLAEYIIKHVRFKE